MAKGKTIITHVEILARAIRSIDEEIEKYEEQAKKMPAMGQMTIPLREKREALNTMYCIETGCDYD